LAREVQPVDSGSVGHSQGPRAGEMSCKDTIHLICWYLEGRLSASVENEIKHHLETCSDCHLVLDAAINTLDNYFNAERAAGTDAGSRAA
jgi:hypothetical protein